MTVSISQLQASHDSGKAYLSYITKTATALSPVANTWIDASVSTGQPKFNAYVGTQLQATQLSGVGNAGIYTGPNTLGEEKKYLTQTQLVMLSGTPSYFLLCDYLMFYPLVDLDDLDPQTTDNIVSLPRYESGEGVRIMIVGDVPSTANADVQITYTNQDGVSGRVVTCSLFQFSTAGVMPLSGTVSANTSKTTPFVPLASGDRGVRSIDEVQMLGNAGGFAHFVLVKPLAGIECYEANIPTEINYFYDQFKLIEIKNEAYLNFIYNCGTNTAGNFRGEIKTVIV